MDAGRPANDLDLMVKPADADAALEALASVGMVRERPAGGVENTISVLAVATPVMALEDVLATKLLALDEHALDYGNRLGIARAVREPIDWESLRARTGDSRYARAFFTLAECLGVAPQATTGEAPGTDGAAHSCSPGVRVLSGRAEA
jgi:hypothetical protein